MTSRHTARGVVGGQGACAQQDTRDSVGEIESLFQCRNELPAKLRRRIGVGLIVQALLAICSNVARNGCRYRVVFGLKSTSGRARRLLFLSSAAALGGMAL